MTQPVLTSSRYLEHSSRQRCAIVCLSPLCVHAESHAWPPPPAFRQLAYGRTCPYVHQPQHSSGIGQRMCGGGLPEHAPSSVPVRSTHLASQLERMLARGEGQRRRVGRVEPLRRPPRAERRAEVRRMALCGGRDRREAVTTWTASRNRQGASMSLSLSCPHRHGGGAWCGLVLVVADVSEPRVLRRQRLHSDTSGRVRVRC